MKIHINRLLFSSLVIFSAIDALEKPSTVSSRAPRSSTIPIKTTQDAYLAVSKVIQDVPKNVAAMSAYEKQQSDVLIRSAKMLYDTARVQILEALLEIDNRITYWQYQKDHPLNYFISKNPMKWVTGPKQEEEIENNLDTLKSHQGELYVLLGQLSEQESIFNRGYKDTFMTDYTKGYEWIDSLLTTLARIKTEIKDSKGAIPFIVRAQLLNAKLENVHIFKDDILSEISETAIPSYFVRNWLKGGTLLFTLGYGYNRGALEQLQNSFNVVTTGLYEILNPVKQTAEDILYAGRGGGFSPNILAQARKTTLELAKKFIRDNSAKYGLSPARQKTIIDGLDQDSYGEYQRFLDDIATQGNLSAEEKSDWKVRQLYQGVKSGLIQFSGLGDFAQGKVYYFELFMLSLQKQFTAVSKVFLFIPATVTGFISYYGYQKLTEKNYGPLRRALVDINSLFVDQTKPLNDEQYGKMLYLIYKLKKQAQKIVPTKKNLQTDFIYDLEKIESPEFSVAAKRAIVEDMFKKYPFLGLVQKK